MLTTGKTILDVANEHSFAVPAFNISDWAMFKGIVEISEETNAPLIVAIHPDEVDLALGALPGQGFRVHLAALALQPGKVVVEEDPIQVCDVNPEAAAVRALPKRRPISIQLRHLDIAAGAIHPLRPAPVFGRRAPLRQES